MKVNLYNQKAEVVGEVELNSNIFEVKGEEHLLAEAVRILQSNARQGTAHTKTRGEVRGGGKKPWKQKGTGRARVGSIRSPIWRKGGITFGPRGNRNWELKLNKKAKTKALFMILSDKVKGHKFVVIDSIHLDPVKTKEFVKILSVFHKSIKDMGKKLLVVLPKVDGNLARCCKNIPGVSSILANSLNLVEILKTDTVLVLKESLPVIEKTYLKNAKFKTQTSK